MRMTKKAKRFVAENDNSPVISGAAFEGGGGVYSFDNGKSIELTLEDSLSLPEGYPKWPWDFAGYEEEAA